MEMAHTKYYLTQIFYIKHYNTWSEYVNNNNKLHNCGNILRHETFIKLSKKQMSAQMSRKVISNNVPKLCAAILFKHCDSWHEYARVVQRKQVI